MNEALKNKITQLAFDGAPEIVAKHEEYIKLIQEEEERHANELEKLASTYESSEKLFALVESVKNSVLNGLEGGKE